MPDFYFPYLLNYAQPDVEQFVIFGVAFLTAILVSAEGQGFAATLLGDSRVKPKDRLHFNVFYHLSILGTLNFFIAGFGWCKEIHIDAAGFKNNPRLSFLVSRLAGPICNLLMANIAASLAWILGRYDVEDKVFTTIVVVNVTMAIYNLIPLAPLPGAAIWKALLPEGSISLKTQAFLARFGPYVIILGFLLFRVTGWDGLDSILTPIVKYVTFFALDI